MSLHDLEAERLYVFHGSGFKVESFVPTQTIYASPFADYAIFMALVNEVNCPKGYQSSVHREGTSLLFHATAETLAQLSDKSMGYIYVFKKADFTQKDEIELESALGPTPKCVIEISRQDFLPSIQIKS